VTIPYPSWTYCANIRTRSSTPAGPIFITGLKEFGAKPIEEDNMWIIDPSGATYVRVPCDDDRFPELGTSGVCCICSRKFQNGIGLATDKEMALGFCCNKHYVDWWKWKHPDEELWWKYDLQDPVSE
jgi:hypothetical protein